ncbi:MAG: UrcA family protein [Pseudomonadota bacterium]
MRMLIVILCQVLWMSAVSAKEERYVVTYSEKELQSVAGMRQVLERIEASAKRYCPTYLEIRSRADVQTCIDEVIQDLVAKVHSPGFTAYVDRRPTEEFASRE